MAANTIGLSLNIDSSRYSNLALSFGALAYNQFFPSADAGLAEQARHKETLGYHDICVGNEPDERLEKFIHVNLPTLLAGAKTKFNDYRDLLERSSGEIDYEEFAGSRSTPRERRRRRW